MASGRNDVMLVLEVGVAVEEDSTQVVGNCSVLIE